MAGLACYKFIGLLFCCSVANMTTWLVNTDKTRKPKQSYRHSDPHHGLHTLFALDNPETLTFCCLIFRVSACAGPTIDYIFADLYGVDSSSIFFLVHGRTHRDTDAADHLSLMATPCIGCIIVTE